MPTKKIERPRNELFDLVTSVLRVNSLLRSVLSIATTSNGLSPLETMVLFRIVSAEKPETVSQVGRDVGHRRQAVQRIATALESNAIIKFVENPNHKRAPLLVATPKGLRVYAKILADATQISEDVFAQIDRTQFRKASDDLNQLVKNLKKVELS